ncbi:hypothetical protein PCE1_003324 [Barthelona sp. PCE]
MDTVDVDGGFTASKSKQELITIGKSLFRDYLAIIDDCKVLDEMVKTQTKVAQEGRRKTQRLEEEMENMTVEQRKIIERKDRVIQLITEENNMNLSALQAKDERISSLNTQIGKKQDDNTMLIKENHELISNIDFLKEKINELTRLTEKKSKRIRTVEEDLQQSELLLLKYRLDIDTFVLYRVKQVSLIKSCLNIVKNPTNGSFSLEFTTLKTTQTFNVTDIKALTLEDDNEDGFFIEFIQEIHHYRSKAGERFEIVRLINELVRREREKMAPQVSNVVDNISAFLGC